MKNVTWFIKKHAGLSPAFSKIINVRVMILLLDIKLNVPVTTVFVSWSIMK